MAGVVGFRHPADWKSAIQQVGNLRYGGSPSNLSSATMRPARLEGRNTGGGQKFFVRNSRPARSVSVNECDTMQFPENAAPGAPVAASAAGVDGRHVVAQTYEALYQFAFGLTGREKDATELTEYACRSLLSKRDVPREARQLERFLFQALHRHFRGWRQQAARARKGFLGRVLPKSSAATPRPQPRARAGRLARAQGAAASGG